jgi:pimeloyl-ACP methyl ester carboxylesterase
MLPALLTMCISTVGAAQDTTAPSAFRLVEHWSGSSKVDILTLDGDSLRSVRRTFQADSATILVPEDRDDPGSRSIELPVVRIRATGTTPREPIFWFGGGPGQSNMRTFDIDYFMEDHDHVMVGYRGVDGSVSLECPEVIELLKGVKDVLADRTLASLGDAFAECHTRLTSDGVDIDGYTIVDVVEDMESVRQALGYERVDLVAESYGTRLAYLYGVMYPSRIHRSVMIGANPPGGLVWDPAQVDDMLEHYGELWAGDPKQAARTTDLVAAIAAVNQDMPRRWLLLPIHPGNVKASAFAMLFHRESAAKVLDTYVAAANGDASGLWLISLVGHYIFPRVVNWGENASKAVSAEFDPSRDYARELMPSNGVMGAPLGKFLWGPGDRWPIAPIPARYREMQTSPVETLILSGSVDFSTPPANVTTRLMPYLPNGRHLVLEEMGHIVDLWYVDPQATHRIVTSFLATGTPDTSLMAYVPMDFEVRWGYPLLAKLVVGGTIVVGFLVLGAGWVGVRFVTRGVRRRRAAVG